MEDIVNVAAWTMNNLCYEIAYSFGLGTDGEQNQQYMENAGRNTSQDFWNIVSRILLFFDSPFLCAFISRCLFAMISSFPQSTFLTVPFPYLEEGEELNFLHPNFQKKKNKEYLSFPYIAFSFPSKQSYILRTQG